MNEKQIKKLKQNYESTIICYSKDTEVYEIARDGLRLIAYIEGMEAGNEWLKRLERESEDMLCAIQTANKSLEDVVKENIQLTAIVEKAKVIIDKNYRRPRFEHRLSTMLDKEIEALKQLIAEYEKEKE